MKTLHKKHQITVVNHNKKEQLSISVRLAFKRKLTENSRFSVLHWITFHFTSLSWNSSSQLIHVISMISQKFRLKSTKFSPKNGENCRSRLSSFTKTVRREITFKIDSRKLFSQLITKWNNTILIKIDPNLTWLIWNGL